jgi:hypothetical protein
MYYLIYLLLVVKEVFKFQNHISKKFINLRGGKMKKYLIIVLSLFIYTCSDDDPAGPVTGCMEPDACNYNASATLAGDCTNIEDGECDCLGNINDCADECGGSAVLDCADECGGSAVLDCADECCGSAVLD